ncbi:glycosyltransferase family 4 protein [Sphingobacterium composti Ten et al. 2007 non Yoo et al. 2007]|uniref:glycosyltransferase family 4 protein n=1 Tax=Sphingobacterium composti TaxID=363260 RepID=UPI001359CC02|nr:glycosyltransferase family 4 protein [Sphingobacterium composti Ten et al. 2007 non Yoo et al. 2007]
MKRILYLTFYFEPDLCAGSFRNTPLIKELASQTEGKALVDVVTTLPNRYSTFDVSAPQFQDGNNYTVYRIAIPKHQSGMKDQVLSFKEYYQKTLDYVSGKDYDLVIASSSRLFTAYLGYKIAKKKNIPLYLDIRDIFYDTLQDVLKDGIIKSSALPFIKYIEKKTFSYASHINLISKGFESYFENYKDCTYSYFPNGIDDVFIEANSEESLIYTQRDVKTIVYAGNLGEGQGLHKIVPEAAKKLGTAYKFVIIGDGGAKSKLVAELERLEVKNVELRDPIKRVELIEAYKNADFLFVHLNNYKAFEKVLPSKLFELATFARPIIAGVGGYANSFVKDNLENTILFAPCDVDDFVDKMKSYTYKTISRQEFIQKYKRDQVNKDMAKSMITLLESN